MMLMPYDVKKNGAIALQGFFFSCYHPCTTEFCSLIY